MKIRVMNLKVPTGSHEAELLEVSLFTAKDGMQFLKLRFELRCKNRNFRMEKNYADPSNNPYFAELIESLGIPLEKGGILETEDLKDYFYNVIVSEDRKGKRYVQEVIPATENEDEDDDEEDEDVGYDDEEDEDAGYDDEEDEDAEDAEYWED